MIAANSGSYSGQCTTSTSSLGINNAHHGFGGFVLRDEVHLQGGFQTFKILKYLFLHKFYLKWSGKCPQVTAP